MSWFELNVDPGDLQSGGLAHGFDLPKPVAGMPRGFVIRYNDQFHAFVNACTHVPMELDWQPGQVFDDSGRWLLCATHGAAYAPDTGQCASGPCRGGLRKLDVRLQGGRLFCRLPVQGAHASV